VDKEIERAERLATLETKLEDIEKALIRLEGKFDVFTTHFVPRNEIMEMFRSRDERISEIKQDMKSQRASVPQWTAILISGLALCVTVIMYVKG
jgi:DNA repair exonuclease SbcCD ATPase subunit